MFFAVLLPSCGNQQEENAAEVKDIQVLLSQASNQSAQEERIRQIHFIDSAIAGKKLSVSQQVQVMEYKAGIYTNQLGDYDKANAIADSMLALIETNGANKYQNEYAQAHYSKGDILFFQHKYNEAYNHYYQARLVGKTRFDSCTLSEYSFRLALILYRQGRFSEAAERFQRSFSESQLCNFDFSRYFRMQQILNNIGLSYFKAGQADSARHFYEQGLDFISRHRQKFPDRQYLNDVAIAVIFGNMADIHRQRGHYFQARDLLAKSIDINTRKGYDNNDAQYSQVKLAEIYAEQGKRDSMYIVLSALRKGLDTVPNARAEMDWNRLMWKHYDRAGDQRAAYGHLMNFTIARDSMENETTELKSADLAQQIKMLENQFQIRALQKDNELKNVYLWIFILACVLGVVIIYFIIRNLARSKKTLRVLQVLNTQVNQQKEQLEKALAIVEEKNRQQERILRAVAHDLRGPVATISMLSDLIKNEKDPQARNEMVGFIRTSCNNSLDLIAEILEAADLSRRPEQVKQYTDVNELISEPVSLLQLKADEKQQVIVTSVSPPHHKLHVNPEKFRRVVSNLVTNAIKFSPKGAEIRVKFEVKNNRNLLTVEDDGIGIPEEIQPKVFDMFTDAKRKGTAGELPYGLGLSICKQIVDAHDGKIWFSSAEDRGTRFFVEIP